MKTKILTLFTFLIMCSSINLFAQAPTIPGSVNLTGAWSSIGKIIPKVGQTTYNSSNYYIGKIYPTVDSSTIISRSYAQFDLSPIPTNATITQVTVNYSTSSNSYSFKITHSANINPRLSK